MADTGHPDFLQIHRSSNDTPLDEPEFPTIPKTPSIWDQAPQDFTEPYYIKYTWHPGFLQNEPHENRTPLPYRENRVEDVAALDSQDAEAISVFGAQTISDRQCFRQRNREIEKTQCDSINIYQDGTRSEPKSPLHAIRSGELANNLSMAGTYALAKSATI